MKFWGRARAPPRPTPWRRFRLCARSIEDHHVAAIVLRPVRSVSAPAARADGGVGGGKGPSARSLRGRTRLGVYGCLWEYIMEALSLGVRARATQSAAHSTARWVRATSVRVEAGCASRPTIDGTHLARKPDGDRPHGRHRRLRFRHFLQQTPETPLRLRAGVQRTTCVRPRGRRARSRRTSHAWKTRVAAQSGVRTRSRARRLRREASRSNENSTSSFVESVRRRSTGRGSRKNDGETNE